MLKTLVRTGKLFAAVFFLSLVGCAAPALKLNQTEGLQPGEGGLLIISRQPYKEGVIFDFKKLSGDGPARMRTEPFRHGVEFAVIRMPAGRYSLNQSQIGNIHLQINKGDGMDFDIHPGRINYIGDISIYSPGPDELTYEIQFKPEQAENLLRSRYPTLLDKYPLELVNTD